MSSWFTLRSALVATSLSLAGALALVGCVAGTAGADDAPTPGDTDTGERVGTATEAVTNNWTAATSDELPPVACDIGNLVSQMDCTGRYCDDMYLYCQSIPSGTFGRRQWLAPFSDESGITLNNCPAGWWVTGLSCTGSYCDNVSLECTEITGITASDCHFVGPSSDETGPISFPPGYFLRGGQCNGHYCDNMYYFICKAS